jgi:hypothetical protein
VSLQPPYGEVAPPADARGRSPWPIIGIVALAVVLLGGVVAVAVASSGSPPAAPSRVAASGTGASGSPSADLTPTASPSPSPSAPAPAGPRYHADTSLCAKIPTGPLGNWLATAPKTLYSPVKRDIGVPGAYVVECSSMTHSTSPIIWCRVEVSVTIYGTTEAARAAYFAQLAQPGEPNQPLKGYGEVAYGRYFTGEEPPTYAKTSGYGIFVQKENLLLDVSVSLIHDDSIGSIPEQTVVARVGPETKAIMSAVPRS